MLERGVLAFEDLGQKRLYMSNLQANEVIALSSTTPTSAQNLKICRDFSSVSFGLYNGKYSICPSVWLPHPPGCSLSVTATVRA